MIVKVKEPQPNECSLLRPGQILFTYLHLAPDPKLTEALIASGSIAIAYETVTDKEGGLPLLSPMSEVAGRLSIQAGAHCLEKKQGGSGILLGGVPGIDPGFVVVLGGGMVGMNAARVAMGMEAHVVVLDISLRRLQQLDLQFGNRLTTIFATAPAIEEYVLKADLVIGAVLVPGRASPKLVSRDMLGKMRPGSVLVDVSVDQGGCFETSRPTTHDNPTYVVDGVVHYCVSNMPGAVPRTASFALNNATLPFILAIADKGYKRALLENKHLLNGLNIYKGQVTYEGVARDLKKKYVSAEEALQGMMQDVKM
jgi:alanine dehydrogenase